MYKPQTGGGLCKRSADLQESRWLLLLLVFSDVREIITSVPVVRDGWGFSMGKITKLSKKEFGVKEGEAAVIIKVQ